MSVNNTIGNYEEQKPITTTWTSGLMNLSRFTSLFIVCTELSDLHSSAPDGYSNGRTRKDNMLLNVGRLQQALTHRYEMIGLLC